MNNDAAMSRTNSEARAVDALRAITVDVGDGAAMTVPLDLEWHLRYGNAETVRFVAAEAVASFDYLINECTREEAWRRLKLMRAAKQHATALANKD